MNAAPIFTSPASPIGHANAINLMAPLQGFYRWLTNGLASGVASGRAASSSTAVLPMQRTSLRRFDSRLPGVVNRAVANRFVANPAVANRVAARTTTQVAPALRVVRVMETKQLRTSAGRMVISGRMADVCAELDRLTQAVH